MTTITRVLVANRAEIASRVFRTCRRLGISTVAVFSDVDEHLPYVGHADLAVHLPGNSPTETYLRGDLIIEAARRAGADAIHPGYGFLSENADFAAAVEAAGLTWIGPTPDSITKMGSKVGSKEIMRAAGVPVLEAPEHPTDADLPLLVKASAGGGGRGMRVVRSLAELGPEIDKARAEAESAFGDGTVFVEPYVEEGRHVEVQVMSTTVVGDRDCSIQRRHQKVVEEAPAPALPDHVREALHDAARKAVEAIDYRGAGTVEFLYDPSAERFFFLEMNTRLQVEHCVTEEVTGLDLVELQLLTAGGAVGLRPVTQEGHSIEVRVYAEDPAADYQPQTGLLTAFEFPSREGIRLETGFASGNQVSTFYDAMLAKVISTAGTRREAAGQLVAALRDARIHGLTTNREQLISILEDERFLAEDVSTKFLADDPHTGARDQNVTVTVGGESDRSEGSPTARTVTVTVCERLAAALALTARAAGARVVVPHMATSWRNVPSQSQRVTFTDGSSAEFYGTRTGFAAEGVTVISATAEKVVLEVDGVRTPFTTTVRGLPDHETVDVDSIHGHTALTREPRFTDPADRVEEGSLLAPMPGAVVAVHAKVGDEVAEGQPLLVLEAMKMQHTITAPHAGQVTELDVAVGDQVTGGTVLAVVHNPDSETAATEEQSA
ncbi:biotin carboxylase N-terminal domain-containing protein [Nocardioides sp. Kera G14]|uniref:ATP-binding protein n=1 Tax=Nocardioides sp. Kera G14 TaxID=2884264 RepID=UPI001D11482C|nr:biotin carboxylase N-terminal domain-containing protein [Nocardioides sp. Kera G14]UDY23496.1 acetyl/propionyl-CoA carboxylase subunit alpha [Nocardioides sp. Kera G14]